MYPPVALTLATGLLLSLAGCNSDGRQTVVPRLSAVPLGTVPWGAWEDKAEANDKPILLYLYNRRSFWCHALASRVLTDPQVVREIRRVTHPVAVDATERPDLFERYGLGTWPSLAVIDPHRGWITGTRYIDSDDLGRLMRRVHLLYDIPDRMEDVERSRNRLAARSRPTPLPLDVVDEGVLRTFTDSVQSQIANATSPSAEILLFLERLGALDTPEIDRVYDERQVNEQGLFSVGLVTEDGVLKDEEMTLTHNVALLMTAAVLASRSGDDAWRHRAQGLLDAVERVLGVEDETGPYFAAGLAGFVTPDSVFAPSLYGEGSRPVDARWIPRWNAQAVSATVHAMEIGLNASTDRWSRVTERLVAGYDERGAPVDRAETLADAALIARALLDVDRLDSGRGLQRIAERILNRAWATFVAPDGEGDRIRAGEDQSSLDRHEPGAIGVLAECLIRLAEETDNPVYASRAGQLLAVWVPRSLNDSAHAGSLAGALRLFVGEER